MCVILQVDSFAMIIPSTDPQQRIVRFISVVIEYLLAALRPSESLP